MKSHHDRMGMETLWIVLFFLLAVSPAEVFSQSDHTARLVEGAKKEGKMLWYTALNIQDADMLTKRFEEKYPFIKTQTLRLGTFQLLTKIQTEARAGADRKS